MQYADVTMRQSDNRHIQYIQGNNYGGLSLHIWTPSNTLLTVKPQSRADLWLRAPPFSGGLPCTRLFHSLNGYVSEVARKAAGVETSSKFNNVQL